MSDIPSPDQEQYPSPTLQNLQQDSDLLTLRALVSTKEAGVIIGKNGKNVAELRDATGVKAGVSKVVQGVHDRVLTVVGSLKSVAKAYALIAQTLLDNPLSSPPTSPTEVKQGGVASIRLLISHNLMGTVIGRQGVKIKHIQDMSGARMIASKEMLPQSTERVVEVKGTVEALQIALTEIGQCLVDDKERAFGTVLYNPTKATQFSNGDGRRSSITRTGNGSDFSNPSGGSSERRLSTSSQTLVNDPNLRTQNIAIPSDMVGCIIGKGGSKISEIRRLSGSRISIAKLPHNEAGERMFTIQGTAQANERALYLLYAQLESEKERRLKAAQEDELDTN
ncbi:cytoplasm protein [Umbelopsis sp. PMI_123]|nr:cytoplasm protein [Umbelopsis sp. PMI_123]